MSLVTVIAVALALLLAVRALGALLYMVLWLATALVALVGIVIAGLA